MNYRLVEILEHGWDLSVRCGACGAGARRSKDHFLGPWRKYLNAEVGELAKRLKCPCGAQASEVAVIGGSYADFGMAHEYFAGRALFIRRTLAEADLDPSLYGFPPIDRAGLSKQP